MHSMHTSKPPRPVHQPRLDWKGAALQHPLIAHTARAASIPGSQPAGRHLRSTASPVEVGLEGRVQQAGLVPVVDQRLDGLWVHPSVQVGACGTPDRPGRTMGQLGEDGGATACGSMASESTPVRLVGVPAIRCVPAAAAAGNPSRPRGGWTYSNPVLASALGPAGAGRSPARELTIAPMDGWLVVPLMLSAQCRWGVRGEGGQPVSKLGMRAVGVAGHAHSPRTQRQRGAAMLARHCGSHAWRHPAPPTDCAVNDVCARLRRRQLRGHAGAWKQGRCWGAQWGLSGAPVAGPWLLPAAAPRAAA